jgi:hypothetical protein
MRIDANRPVCVFDTSGLLDFARGGTPASARLQQVLPSDGQYFYHPITLGELADYVHEPVWKHRQPHVKRWAEAASLRRGLITVLYHHKKDDCARLRLYGRRFLPFSVCFEYFSFVAHQRQQVSNVRQTLRDGPVPVAAMTDHQILGAALYFARSRYEVTFVSGDKFLLGAAAKMNLGWRYSKDPDLSHAFPW